MVDVHPKKTGRPRNGRPVWWGKVPSVRNDLTFFQRAPPDAPPAAEPTAAPMAAPWSAPLDDSPTENEPAQLERANAEARLMREMRIVFMVVGRLTMIDSNAGHFN